MQPRALLQLAKRLLDPPDPPEEDIRCAAHSAYYAVYHLVCQHFKVDPQVDWDAANHWEVRTRLSAADARNLPRHIAEAKRFFNSLHLYRVKADYHLNVPFPREGAEDAVAWAEGVFARMPADKKEVKPTTPEPPPVPGEQPSAPARPGS